jgi:MFS family permease
MLVQGIGLLLGIVFVVEVGHAESMGALIAAMIGFGLCKGVYDAGIFASVFEFVRPLERASVVGLMNLLGWGGGALGPLAVGLLATYGHGTAMERMSNAIAWSGAAYAGAAILVLSALRTYRTTPH